MMRKRTLITGGAGFIGSHLAKKLITDGHTIVCLDDFSTGSKKNIQGLLDNPYFELVDHDINDPLYLEVDEIYNLACPASPIQYQKDPIRTMKTNVIGSVNMLELSKKLNIPILQSSTSEVYGDPEISPQSESYRGNVSPIGPRACYDEGKRAAETLFFDYHRQSQVNTKVVRIFNTYGPYLDKYDGRVVSNFIFQALKNQPITIYGDGSQTRSFCYIDDLVEGLIKMMNSNHHGPINLGNPAEYSIKDLAKKIIQLTASRSQIEYYDLPIDDPKHRNPDITLAQEELQWNPQTSLEEGLTKTIDYFKSII